MRPRSIWAKNPADGCELPSMTCGTRRVRAARFGSKGGQSPICKQGERAAQGPGQGAGAWDAATRMYGRLRLSRA
eukprot:167244-Prymnesium_polylepis.1